MPEKSAGPSRKKPVWLENTNKGGKRGVRAERAGAKSHGAQQTALGILDMILRAKKNN